MTEEADQLPEECHLEEAPEEVSDKRWTFRHCSHASAIHSRRIVMAAASTQETKEDQCEQSVVDVSSKRDLHMPTDVSAFGKRRGCPYNCSGSHYRTRILRTYV